HRLDRVTSGVLLLAIERRWRGPYQSLFERRQVRKTYRALAPWQEALESPVVVRNHLRKDRGAPRAEVVPGAPVNAETLVEMEARDGDLAIYRLSPRTGRTHQLRMHLAGLGSPIVGDPLYPEVLDVSVDDFAHPLQLLASELEFTDPVDGTDRRFVSARTFPLGRDVMPPQCPPPMAAGPPSRRMSMTWPVMSASSTSSDRRATSSEDSSVPSGSSPNAFVRIGVPVRSGLTQ